MRLASRLAVLLAAACTSAAAHAQPASYDPATRVLTIPAVSAPGVTFENVRLQDDGRFNFSLLSVDAAVEAWPAANRYDVATGTLTLSAVQVGNDTYTDVTLRDSGQLNFALQSATPLPAATRTAIAKLLADGDSLYAQAVHPDGHSQLLQADACWRHDGQTRDHFIADWDANSAERVSRNAYQVGRRSGPARVLAQRQLNNPDGSSRTEIDIEYDVSYRDGTTARNVRQTLISGSSAGTPGCSNPDVDPQWRVLGNQQLVGTQVRSRNTREQRHQLASGAALSTSVTYRRSVQWFITDPMGNATHVIVSGPGPSSSGQPFSLKFLSPRLMSTALEMSGKVGNFLNWASDDGFRFCLSAGNAAPPASEANCTVNGASRFDHGWTTSTPNAAADASFAAQGWRAGGTYRFDVYNDSGWRTVNGHAGRTPIATYYARLEALPMGFVELAGSGPSNDAFPRMNFGGSALPQVVANLRSATPAPLSASWNAPLTPASFGRLGLLQGWEFHNGPRSGNAAGALFPGYRVITYSYPGSTATANPSWIISPLTAGQASKNFVELSLLYSNRNDGQVISLVTFQ